ncbi:MAG: redoxin domain-containing protein [Phycisphaeraceae bacterium]|nr:redoxin domain-containing protein [Phycisphaeraceae bacterium]MCB9847156.1 redoxin domain-containing protein [Phycisphaeraceae bacterium]
MSARRCASLVVCVVMAWLCVTPWAEAQEPAAPVEDAQARAVFGQFAARSRGVGQRHERAVGTYRFDTDIRIYRMMSGQTQRLWEYKYRAPNRFWINLDSIEMVCNGERLWAAMRVSEQYADVAAPRRGEMLRGIEGILGDWGACPVTLALLLADGGDELSTVMGGPTVWTGHEAVTVDGVACMRFDFVVSDLPTPGEERGSMTGSVWFGVESGMVRSITMDMTGMLRATIESMRDTEMAPMLGLEEDSSVDDALRSAQMDIEIESLPEDAIEDSAFRIPDAPGAERVETFGAFDAGAYSGRGERIATDLTATDFVGGSAPALEGRTSDGRFVDLSELRGRVVLLVVSPRFAPGLATSWLRAIDTLHEAFAELPVSLVGLVSSDHDPFTEDGTVDTSGLSFPVVMDDENDLLEDFRAGNGPLLFVIDADGIVQAVHTKKSEIKAETLIEEVARLLEGDRLYDEASVNARREEISAAEALRELKSPTLLIDGMNEDRIHQQRLSRWGMSQPAPFEAAMRVIDVNRDGVPDLVAVDGNAGLLILDGSDFSSETVEFETVDEPGTNIAYFDRIRTGGGECWFVMTSRWVSNGGDTTQTIGVFRPDGSKVWRRTLRAKSGEHLYTHALEQGISIGDLDGDGLDEIALGLSVSSDNEDVKDALMAIDARGDVIASMEMEYGPDVVRIIPATAGKPGWIAITNLTGVARVTIDR